eukprot:GDKJ01025788.1.p1 GENE.GDKJ01025788.1~~GDKJ01025788.1.p1  ORF type:complete len:124 (+),score=3.48 GDKJ01025788.1:219-590(+)
MFCTNLRLTVHNITIHNVLCLTSIGIGKNVVGGAKIGNKKPKFQIIEIKLWKSMNPLCVNRPVDQRDGCVEGEGKKCERNISFLLNVVRLSRGNEMKRLDNERVVLHRGIDGGVCLFGFVWGF